MIPDDTYQPEVDLPRPQTNGGGEARLPTYPAGAEQASVSAELPQHSPAATPTQQPAASPLSTSVVPPAPTQSSQNDAAAAGQATALAANDTDLIEKEWVVKAKSIIEKTKDNPHEQTRDMSKFKADYVKKRYNKELKVSEG